MSTSNQGKLMDEISDLAVVWKRPGEVPYPNVWCRFQSKPKHGKALPIKIVDLTSDRFEESIEFMTKYYHTEEPLCVSSKLLEDELSVRIHKKYMRSKILEKNTSILAVLDEDVPKPEIGLQFLSISSKDDDPLPEVPGEAINKLIKIDHDIKVNNDPFEVLGVDTIIRDWGLCVKPEYRGMDIGYNILLSLKNLANSFGIKGCMIMFTSIQSQKLADRVGFKLYNEIVYNDYRDKNGQIVFPVEGTKSVKLMGSKYV